MIAVDASALVAILLDEPEAQVFARHLIENPASMLSPIGYWEAATRLRGLRGETGVDELDTAMRQLGIRIAPASSSTAVVAVTAERDFGKRTPAKLNMGDCFAYALAKESSLPLLFKGNDFSQTDIVAALPA